MRKRLRLVLSLSMLLSLTNGMMGCGKTNKLPEENKEPTEISDEVSDLGPALDNSNDDGNPLNTYDDQGNVIGKADESNSPIADKEPEKFVQLSDDEKPTGANDYLTNFNATNSCLDDPSLLDGATSEMENKVKQEYDLWNNYLNEVYSKIKSSVSASKVTELDQEESEWDSQKTETAEKVSKEYTDKTKENLVKQMSLAEQTRDRCYFLVNHYMK